VSDFDPGQVISPDQPAVEALPAPSGAGPGAPAPTVALAEGDGVAVPALDGKTVREAVEALQKVGLAPMLVGNGLALEEEPEAGSTVRRGTRITVRFGRPGDGQAQQALSHHRAAASGSAQRE
jgi:stage V sporulation protein D (sporulation-specific penicillin-binding protein)